MVDFEIYEDVQTYKSDLAIPISFTREKERKTNIESFLFCSSRILPGKTSILLDALTDFNHFLPTRQSSYK